MQQKFIPASWTSCSLCLEGFLLRFLLAITSHHSSCSQLVTSPLHFIFFIMKWNISMNLCHSYRHADINIFNNCASAPLKYSLHGTEDFIYNFHYFSITLNLTHIRHSINSCSINDDWKLKELRSGKNRRKLPVFWYEQLDTCVWGEAQDEIQTGQRAQMAKPWACQVNSPQGNRIHNSGERFEPGLWVVTTFSELPGQSEIGWRRGERAS